MAPAAGASKFLWHFKRSIPSLVIGGTCWSMIYFDYTHTQAWKSEVKLQSELIEKAKIQA